MLQAIRDHAQGWIAWVIVGLIIITFALFGIEQYAKGNKTVVVAQVNGEDITDVAFLNLYNRQKSRLQQQFGEMYDQVVQDSLLREQVLDALIQSAAIQQWANANHMLISDAQLASTIHNADVFFKDGKFDEETYQSVLLRNGLSVARFEYEQRQYLAEQQNTQLTQASAFATKEMAAQIVALQLQKRTANTLLISKQPFESKVKLSDAEIAQYYDENKTAFVVPQQLIVDAIELSQSEIAKNLTVTDAQLLAFYEENKAQFVSPEKRQASHILIKTDAGTPEDAALALEKIKTIQQAIAAGENFAELAKKHSQDPGSAKKGGDLGNFQQGMMVPEFDEVVFSLNVGQVSEPVKTDFGYHLIKLDAITPKAQKSFEQVRADVEAQYRAQEAEKQYFTQLETLNTLVFEEPNSLVPAADALGLKVSTSQPFSKNGLEEGVAQYQKVVVAAFSEDVLTNNLNSAVIEVAPNHSVVVRVNEVIAPRQQTLDEVRDVISQTLTANQAEKAIAEFATKLLADLKAGATLKSLANQGKEFKSAQTVTRQDRNMSAEINGALFKMPKPQQGAASHQWVALTNGDVALIELTQVTEGTMPASNAAMQQEVNNTLEQLMGGAEVYARTQALVEQAEVVKKPIYQTIK